MKKKSLENALASIKMEGVVFDDEMMGIIESILDDNVTERQMLCEINKLLMGGQNEQETKPIRRNL